ncbi:MAG: putative porin, partial [Phycisphaerales bacterium]|nr:putative porin [Phycisphaerales bacterium]
MKHSLVVTLLGFGGVLCAGNAMAYDGAPASAPPLEEKSPFSFYGDLRLRWESDWDSRMPNGVKREDRDRFRLRARLGIKFDFSPSLSFDARIRTGDNNSQQSPHITIWQDNGDEGDQHDITLDRAYLRLKLNDQTTITGGRTGLLLWKPNEMFWDDDVYVDGAGISHAFGANSAWKLTAQVALLPDGDASLSLDERSPMAAIQLRRDITCGVNELTLAQSFLFIEDNSHAFNAVNDDMNSLFSYTNAQYTINKGSSVPVKIGADIMFNLQHGPAGDHPDDRFGFDAYVSAGRYRDPGDWTLGYAFARIERWSVPRFLAQDDWVRWGSATQTRSSDFYGHELSAGYVLADNVKLLGRLFVADAIT